MWNNYLQLLQHKAQILDDVCLIAVRLMIFWGLGNDLMNLEQFWNQFQSLNISNDEKFRIFLVQILDDILRYCKVSKKKSVLINFLFLPSTESACVVSTIPCEMQKPLN